MSRAERLLQLMQCLRRHRYPVSGNDLASTLNISLRTLYRDIASLQAQGAQIEGEAGVGYVLKANFTLPPLMFSTEEIEALVLGIRFVAERADASLAHAAKDVLAKISAVLPDKLRHDLDSSALLVGPGQSIPIDDAHSRLFREAIRGQEKLHICYQDQKGEASDRIIWPFAIGYFDQAMIIVAWCELRQDIRHFRLDRVSKVLALGERYPSRRQSLLKEWKKRQGISDQGG